MQPSGYPSRFAVRNSVPRHPSVVFPMVVRTHVVDTDGGEADGSDQWSTIGICEVGAHLREAIAWTSGRIISGCILEYSPVVVYAIVGIPGAILMIHCTCDTTSSHVID